MLQTYLVINSVSKLYMERITIILLIIFMLSFYAVTQLMSGKPNYDAMSV